MANLMVSRWWVKDGKQEADCLILDENILTAAATKRLYKLVIDYRVKTKEGYTLRLTKQSLEVFKKVGTNKTGWRYWVD